MASYTAILTKPLINPARQDAPETRETDEAAVANYDAWIDWLDDAKAGIAAAGGDYEDLDGLLAVILDHVTTEAEAAAKGAEERAGKYARDVLLEVMDSNRLVARVSRTQREAREKQAADAKALAKRLARVDSAIEGLTRENAELRAKLTACEENLAKASNYLEREISRERSLRRLLDAQRNRPHTQKIASGLARLHAEKLLQAAASKAEANLQ